MNNNGFSKDEERPEMSKLDDIKNGDTVVAVENGDPATKSSGDESKKAEKRILYTVEDRPPIGQTIFLGFQHFITFFGTGIAPPLVLSVPLCMSQDKLAVSTLIGTAFFIEGVITFLQATFGVRLPIVQGGNAAFLAPAIAVLNSRGECPVTLTANSTMEERSEYTEAWQVRMRELQGAIMLAGFVQMAFGFFGIIGWLLRFIGPVTVAPTIAMVGISVYPPAAGRAGQHWGIALLTIVLILLFTLYLRKVKVPLPGRNPTTRKFEISGRVPIFTLYPIALGVLLSWFFAFILTAAGVFPETKGTYGYGARTDLNRKTMNDALWFSFPYPGQWGTPTFTVGAFVGMLTSVLVSVIDSIGDYFAAARLSGAPPPPAHAINRGIGFEGFGLFLAGIWGTGNGTGTFGTNIGVLGITKVGSRIVIQACAIFMIVIGLFGKAGALFASIPIPIVGAMLCVLFGSLLAVGLSNLQFLDLNSPRNLTIIGFTLFMGLVLPYWVGKNPAVLVTGVSQLDQLIKVLLSTGMFITGFFALLLDNTVPGSVQERGLVAWTEENSPESGQTVGSLETYDFPCGMGRVRKWKWTRFIPFSPTFAAPPSCRSGGGVTQ